MRLLLVAAVASAALIAAADARTDSDDGSRETTPEARVRELLEAGGPRQQAIVVEGTLFVDRGPLGLETPREALRESPIAPIATRARLVLEIDLSSFGEPERWPEQLEVCFGVRLRGGPIQTVSKRISRPRLRPGKRWIHQFSLVFPGGLDEVQRAAVILTGPNGGSESELVLFPVLADLGLDSTGSAAPEDLPRTELPAIRLLLPPEAILAGRHRLGALVGRDGVARVRFLVDGRVAGEAEREPWETTHSFDRAALPHTIQAVALAADGRELARDVAVVNAPADEPWVRILPITGPENARVVGIRVRPPAGRRLLSIEIHAADRPMAVLTREPFEVSLPEDTASAAFVRAVARFDDGSLVEDVAPLFEEGFGEVVDVSLAEVFPRIVDQEGRPARVDPAELELLDEGTPRPIEGLVWSTEMPLLLGISVDTSGSMAPYVDQLKEELAGLLAVLEPGRDRAFLTHFAAVSRLDQPPTTDPARLAAALRGVEVRGTTVLYDAIVHALIQFERKLSRRALLVLTDGEPTAGRFDGVRTLPVAQRLGVPIYVLLTGRRGTYGFERRDVLELQRLALGSGGDLIEVTDPKDLVLRLRELVEELRSQAVVTFTPSPESSKRRDWHRVEIRCRRPGIRVEGELGYLARNE